MNAIKYKFILITVAVFLSSCFDDDWRCATNGKTMYSINSSGKLGGAQKGCSCQQIRSFEMSTFGFVDSAALKSDFGC